MIDKIKTSQKSKNKIFKQIKDDTLLLAIPQAQIQIYSKHILRLFTQSPRKNTLTLSTLPSLTNAIQKQLKQKRSIKDSQLNNQIIPLNDSDFAFQIDQQQKSVQIVNVVKNSTIIQFKVNSLSTLFTTQSIFRTKMCELGFEKRYSILKKIGNGASADVYLIQRISDGNFFAAKIISLKKSDQKAYATFINEVKLLRVLKHKYIVRLQSVYYSKKCLYQVLQYLNGGTLLNELKQNLLTDENLKWKAIGNITNGIQYMRQKNVLHRDLKLQNILIRKLQDGTKEYVISDFGLGCWLTETNPLFQRCGTPGYIAPQILRQKDNYIIKSSTDIFSLGVLAHFIFMSKSLFKYTGDTRSLLQLNKKANINLNDVMYQKLTVSELKFLQMTLQINPEKRAKSFQLIEQFKDKFQQSYKIKENKQKFMQIASSLRERSQLRTLVRDAPNSNRKIQSKETKQEITRKSLQKSLQKLAIKNSSLQKEKMKTERSNNRGFFSTIMEKISFKQKRQDSLKKKLQKSIKKVQMKSFITK